MPYLNAVPDLPRRILVIRPDHLGDVLLTGPTLTRLRALWPDADVTLLVGPWCENVAERLPGVDRVRTLDFPYFDRRPRTSLLAPYRRLFDAARMLRASSGSSTSTRSPVAATTRAPYDVAIVARDDDRWSALLARAAGIPIVAGHDTPRTRWVLTHKLPAARRPAHVAAAGVALVEAVGAWTSAASGSYGANRSRRTYRSYRSHGSYEADPRTNSNASSTEAPPITPAAHPLSFRLTDDDRARAAALLGSNFTKGDGAPTRGPLAIHHGSGSPIKRWPPERWAAVVRAATAPGEAVVLTGGPGEAALTAELAAALAAVDRTSIDLAGKTDVATLAAVFERCRAVLGPDSGPLHLAVAVGTPSVHLYGPAAAARFGPWGAVERHVVVGSGLACAPCGRLEWGDVGDHPCVRTVEVGRVRAALERAVRTGPTRTL
ncbi:MAG: glycosyltransferase family 9 protein [Ardenticatenales bacterium]